MSSPSASVSFGHFGQGLHSVPAISSLFLLFKETWKQSCELEMLFVFIDDGGRALGSLNWLSGALLENRIDKLLCSGASMVSWIQIRFERGVTTPTISE